MQDLRRDPALERLVAGQVDGRHAAAAELRLQPIAAGEHCPGQYAGRLLSSHRSFADYFQPSRGARVATPRLCMMTVELRVHTDGRRARTIRGLPGLRGAICALCGRRCSAAPLTRPRGPARRARGSAFSGEPESNGGSGSYSMPSWIAARQDVAELERGEVQRHVDPGRDAGRGDDLAVDDDPLGHRLGAVACAAPRGRPSDWSPACPRAARRRRAPASRCTPRSSTCSSRARRAPSRAWPRSPSSGRLPSPPGISSTSGSGSWSSVASALMPSAPVSVRFTPVVAATKRRSTSGMRERTSYGPIASRAVSLSNTRMAIFIGRSSRSRSAVHKRQKCPSTLDFCQMASKPHRVVALCLGRVVAFDLATPAEVFSLAWTSDGPLYEFDVCAPRAGRGADHDRLLDRRRRPASRRSTRPTR